MAEHTTPTLEDLRDVPEAAWLWDGARARIVWANREGIAYFGGESLFDLVDRPFDFLEPGVEMIAGLARNLRRGQVESALLHFPSAGASGPIACRCMIHALADGRPGVLVVARQPASAEAQKTADDIMAAFDLLPSAALLIARDGSVRHLNAAALLLLGAGQRASLSALVGDEALAEDLLARVEAAGTIVITRKLPMRLGERDIRLTLRLLGRAPGHNAFAFLLLDDVTERRALERKLSGTPPAAAPEEKPSETSVDADATPARPLSSSDAEAFEKLGKTLEEGIRHVPRREQPEKPSPAALSSQQPVPAAEPPRAAVPPPPPEPPQPERRKLPRIPDVVRGPLDSRQDAVLVAKDGQLLYANPAAATLFGFETAEDVINDAALFSRFGQLGQSLPGSDIARADGKTIHASVQMTVIPWLSGPARHFVLRKAEPPKQERGELKLASLALPKPETLKEKSPEQAKELPPQPATPQPKPSAEVIQLPVPSRGSTDADEELRAILDTAADGIITLDAEARIHTFSAGAEAIFGYRIADVAGKPFIELLASDSRKTVRDYLAALQGPVSHRSSTTGAR